MKFSTVHAVLGSAVVLLSAPCGATASHEKMHQLFEKKHGSHGHAHGHSRGHGHAHGHLHVHHTEESSPLQKRGGSCAFPTDEPDLISVTPGSKNAGWAMSPDMPCDDGTWCQYACKPGMVMAQWDPKAKSYTYPLSMNGGIYCDGGKIKKPFPDKPYCVDGSGAVKAVNKCGKPLSWCQTLLPGTESMLSPTVVDDEATIAVPDHTYWCSTAAHFYINPPGSGSDDCKWGDPSQPIGNWSPYVAGANTDANGETFVKIDHNPIFLDSALFGKTPTFGVEIQCPDGGCNGLPCRIDPSKSKTAVESNLGAIGAGGSAFCVVTVPKGKTAHIVTFNVGDDPDSDSGDDDESEDESSTPPPKPTTTEEPTTSTTPTTTSTPEPTTTSTSTTSTTSSSAKPIDILGIFHENGTSTDAGSSSTTKAHTTTTATRSAVLSTTVSEQEPAPTTKDKDNEAGRQHGSAALASLIVAFIAAACFF